MLPGTPGKWGGNFRGSEVGPLVTDVAQFLFGDDLGLAHGDHRLPGGRPDEAPRTRGDRPESLPGLHVDEGQGVVAVLGADGHEKTGTGGRLLRGVTHPRSEERRVGKGGRSGGW